MSTPQKGTDFKSIIRAGLKISKPHKELFNAGLAQLFTHDFFKKEEQYPAHGDYT